MYIPGTTRSHSSCTSLFILIFMNPQYTVLHILSHCTFYSLFYFIICSYFYFILTYIYIYSLVLCFIVLFRFFCTVHWADLSWLTFHYWLYPVWLCMWRIIKNLELWEGHRDVCGGALPLAPGLQQVTVKEWVIEIQPIHSNGWFIQEQSIWLLMNEPLNHFFQPICSKSGFIQ